MTNVTYDKIVDHPKYQELMRKRNRFTGILLAVFWCVLLGFAAFAMNPDAFSARIAPGSSIGWGMLCGFGLIVFFFLLVWLYVWRSNEEFDALSRSLIQEVNR